MSNLDDHQKCNPILTKIQQQSIKFSIWQKIKVYLAA